jgi:hypothetical protein
MTDAVAFIEPLPGLGLMDVAADPTVEALLDFTRLELIEAEAIYRRAVEVVFDAIPASAWKLA